MKQSITAFLLMGFLVTVCPASETELINAQTPWRAYLVAGRKVVREGGAVKLAGRGKPATLDQAMADPQQFGFSRLPGADWMKPDFDASCWARYVESDLMDFLGDYGVAVSQETMPSLLCLRTSFGVADPAGAADLKATVTCLGGAVVYVNGREVGRGFLPRGPVNALTPAEDYPAEAYTADDGTTPLPDLSPETKPDPKFLPRYQKRIRTFSVNIPREALVKGSNVLAIEIHQAAVAGPTARQGWAHLGVHGVTLTSASGGGAIPYAEAAKGVRVWSANPEDQVADTPSEKSLIRRSMFKTVLWAHGMAVRGIQAGNPFEPVLPVRMAAPRNSVCSGQAVVTDLAGLRGVTATIRPLKGSQGEIPPGAVEIRYAAQREGLHYCDAILPTPPASARTVPVWMIVQVPKNQAPGWYTGALSVQANGRDFSVPVQVLVTGATLPDGREFTSNLSASSSYETIALHYKVKPWSDEHFRLMEPSLKMLGQLGNDVLQVPVITQNQFNWKLPLIRFHKAADGLKPDFTILQKYLDLYMKHCAPPKALCLYVWDAPCAKRGANVYEGRQIPNREFQPRMPLTVQVIDPATGAGSDAPAPQFADAGAEQFYKRLVDGVAGIVEKRGWSRRVVMLGMGGDNRPSQEDGVLLKQWLPYVRWNLLSHFSGDASSFFNKDKEAKELLKAGRFIAVGGHEVGVKEHPWNAFCHAFTAAELEKELVNNAEYLDLGCGRWHWQDYSPPLIFNILPMMWGNFGRLGLDYWAGRGGPQNASYFTASTSITAPGPAGAEPTVRFQMFREGEQNMELRLMIARGCQKLPDEQRKAYRDLLDEFGRRLGWSGAYLSQHELGYDWRGYVAQLQEAAADLAGVKSDARWNQAQK